MKYLKTYNENLGLGFDVEKDIHSLITPRLTDYLEHIFGTKDKLLREFAPIDDLRYFGNNKNWIRFKYNKSHNRIDVASHIIQKFRENFALDTNKIYYIMRYYIGSIYNLKVDNVIEIF